MLPEAMIGALRRWVSGKPRQRSPPEVSVTGAMTDIDWAKMPKSSGVSVTTRDESLAAIEPPLALLSASREPAFETLLACAGEQKTPVGALQMFGSPGVSVNRPTSKNSPMRKSFPQRYTWAGTKLPLGPTADVLGRLA